MENTPKKKRPFLKKMSTLLTIICIVIFAYSLFHLIKIGYMYYHNDKILTNVQSVYENLDLAPVDEEVDIGERKIRSQFIDLQKINEDVVGWISIEDTKVNYPILQAEDNAYYLNKNYQHDRTAAGSIFMDFRNDVADYDPNIILYGHRMKDNSMFDSLEYFLDEDFFNNHGVIQIDTLYESYDAQVFAAYSTTTDFDYIQTEFDEALDFITLFSRMKNNSKYESDVEVNLDDQIITLSTCDYLLDPNEGRLVVHAKLVKKN